MGQRLEEANFKSELAPTMDLCGVVERTYQSVSVHFQHYRPKQQADKAQVK